jgi:signal transduction histidine kinase
MPTRSLFLKIFLWFWLAMVLITLTLFVSSTISQKRNARAREDAMDLNMTPLLADTLAEMYDRQGSAGMSSLVAHVGAFPFTPFLFKTDGTESLNRTLAPRGMQAFMLALANHNTQIVRSSAARWVAQWVQTASGKQYVLVLQIMRPPDPLLGAPTQVQLLRFLIILLIIGAICLWITRHIARPILELREAANQLAQGNLRARVQSSALRRNDELGDLAWDFNYMASQLESLVASRQRLISDISHELRSPLARLSVALGIAQRSANKDSQAALRRIEREALRLNELIGELLRLARLESGAEKLSEDHVDLEALVQEIADDANFEASARNRSVRVCSSFPCTVVGNADILRSAVENVVRNAVNYTAEGSEVEISLQPSRDNHHAAVISVRDHGPGVPASSLQSIFEPFYRLENSRDRQSGGTGLGLSITDRSIHSHGGSVRARNAADGGLIVELSLPVETALSPAPLAVKG